MATKNFTFKVHKPTGQYRSFASEYADIKLGGKKCGYIQEASTLSRVAIDEKYSISFSIIDESETCGWKNIRLKAKFPSMIAAKEFVKSKIDAIQNQYKLYFHED